MMLIEMNIPDGARPIAMYYWTIGTKVDSVPTIHMMAESEPDGADWAAMAAVCLSNLSRGCSKDEYRKTVRMLLENKHTFRIDDAKEL